MKIDEARQKLTEREAAYRRHTVPIKSIFIGNDHPDFLAAGTEAYPLNDDETLRIICSALQAPGAYLRDLPRELRAELLRHHLREGHLGADLITVITKSSPSGGKRLVAFEKGDLLLLSGAEVLDAVVMGIAGVPAPAEVKNLCLHDDQIMLDILSEAAAVEPRPGDVIRAGLRVRHSLLGHFATDVSAYIERLACANGAVSRTCIDKKQPRTRRLPASRAGAKELQQHQVERLARAAWEGLAQKLQSIRQLPESRFASDQEVVAHMRALLSQNRLSTTQEQRRDGAGENILKKLLAAWEQEGKESTAYGVMNAVTRLATHGSGLSQRDRFALSRLGGLLAFQHFHLCPRCFSLLSRELPPERTPAPDCIRPSVN
jgi:hypothetical protein